MHFFQKELRAAAQALKLKLDVFDAQRDTKGLEIAFQTAKQKQVGAIMTITTLPAFSPRENPSLRLPANTACRLFTHRMGLWMPAVSCPTGRLR